MGINCGSPKILCLTFFLYTCSLLPWFPEAASTINQGEFLRDGETILSPRHNFELGFFSPESSNQRYLGIWYKKVSVQTVIWVANRNRPIAGKNGSLTIGNNGNLIVLDQNGTLLWSSDVLIHSERSTATLMDTGNLILSSSTHSTQVLWQSFDHPTDSFLPGTVLHMNSSTGENHMFRSWKSVSDPSVGNYSSGVDTSGTPQIMTWQGSKRLWRSGHWNGLLFLGIPSMRSFHLYGFKFRRHGGEWDVTYRAFGNETVRFYIWWNGSTGLQSWNQTAKEWRLMQIHPANECEKYNRCGPFAVCTGIDFAKCDCIKGFKPRSPGPWKVGNWTDGCTRRAPLQCNGDGFTAMERVKLPDFADVVMADNRKACKQLCLTNCSCNAYAFVTGIQCMMWSVDLVDIEQFIGVGETLFVRLNRSEFGKKTRIPTGALIAGTVAGAVGVSILLLWRFGAKLKSSSNSKCRSYKFSASNLRKSSRLSTVVLGKDDVSFKRKESSTPDLQIFSFSSILAATNNFAKENKLGQGGFGPVYKGILPGGQEIAVKRLSKLSKQGLQEFKTEIKLIAKLHHTNLVRLLGCSIEGEEKLLLYEYLPNKSLDFLLFDQTKQANLDWSTRYTIIKGIARGMLYLHRDSRLRIIHRDLKASNILLDEVMNPKISDFGLARMFAGNDNEANTVRIVGTYGYMSPEYAMEGIFSVKSDVYSFGVLLLEIVSGRKNASFRTNGFSSLVPYSWHLWRDGRAMELIDPSMADACSRNTVLRCIHVAMLCVQDSAVKRPTMSSVVLMLESEVGYLPVPRQPAVSSLVCLFHEISLEGDEGSTELVGR